MAGGNGSRAENPLSAALFLVATPIGNLEDMSPRGRRVLAEADVVAAEDTRHTQRLLSHFGIRASLVALHEHNEARAVPALLERLQTGQSVAVVSDAGTPLVSDPGFLLVRAAREAGVPVVAIPGPSAVLTALAISGLPTDRFTFEGFLPARGAQRRKRLQALAAEMRTMVFFEAPHRITDCLRDMIDAFGPGRASMVARELTKRHEESRTATLGELLAWLEASEERRRGEFVVAVGGAEAAPATADVDLDRLLRPLVRELGVKSAARLVAEATGGPRNRLYERALALAADG